MRINQRQRSSIPAAATLLASACCCLSAAQAEPPFGVQAAFTTHLPPDGNDQLESVAVWIAPDARDNLLLITDKERDCVERHDPVTNSFIGRIGRSGTGPGELRQPNGLAVLHDVQTPLGARDVLLVVETLNSRVSIFGLPDGTYLGQLGEGELAAPMGIGVSADGDDHAVWITSVGHHPDRVSRFSVIQDGLQLAGRLEDEFEVWPTASLESIVLDPVADRLYLCDEGAAGDILIYDQRGVFIDRFGEGHFTDDPEGIALYDLTGGQGYLIVADQSSEPTEFEVFDRVDLLHLGKFAGLTRYADGIGLTQRWLPNLPSGAFFAVHADSAAHAYGWGEIAAAMDLAIHMTGGASGVPSVAVPVSGPRLSLSCAPNPFRPSTTLTYELEATRPVRLTIHDVTGRRIRTLVERAQSPGRHTPVWDGRDTAGEPVAAGRYFVRVEAGDAFAVEAITLLR